MRRATTSSLDVKHGSHDLFGLLVVDAYRMRWIGFLVICRSLWESQSVCSGENIPRSSQQSTPWTLCLTLAFCLTRSMEWGLANMAKERYWCALFSFCRQNCEKNGCAGRWDRISRSGRINQIETWIDHSDSLKCWIRMTIPPFRVNSWWPTDMRTVTPLPASSRTLSRYIIRLT